MTDQLSSAVLIVVCRLDGHGRVGSLVIAVRGLGLDQRIGARGEACEVNHAVRGRGDLGNIALFAGLGGTIRVVRSRADEIDDTTGILELELGAVEGFVPSVFFRSKPNVY